MKTVVGLLNNKLETRKVAQELIDSGFGRNAIKIMTSEETRQKDFLGQGDTQEPFFELGTGFGILSGDPTPLTSMGVLGDDASLYAEGVSRGGYLVTVSADNDFEAEKAAEILGRYGAVDIEQQARSWREAGVAGRSEVFEGRQAQPVVGQREGVESESYARQGVGAMDDDEFIRHFNATYGQSGERFEETYRSAYHFAESESSSHPQLRGRDWSEVEEDIHRDWESSHPGTWYKVEKAIHYGWDRVRRH